MARRAPRNPWWVLLVVILAGGLLGSVIAEAVVGYPLLGFLAREVRAGVDPAVTLDLRIVSVTFGTIVRLNLAMVLGVVIAVWIYRLL
ncbi:MAG: DUF4321 domain-containing protein [Armatimonadota bacterium]|nr:DUF4321 domain-containing protein [Armatimonadota bacterium]MDR7422263.1 DUF4321 domain-containing protein [Armatimonadota bacterium]MDR7454679.1 DUF4321 domain-containing protein [Armatimonadota bacterium]MDR7456314.1 DUF4321 domain-containing protein [Armatimonadota bacterium]MDR7496311.1 DUF4321 domain-containing protein [Armatimonadota bacterium]